MERDEALRAANEAIVLLQRAQETLDTARAKVHQHQSLATVLLADTDRAVADAATRMERIMRFIAVARARAIVGRWPMVATRQRDEAENAADTASALLTQAQTHIAQAKAKLHTNPSLGEAIIADVASSTARSLTQTERIARLLTEAGIGRE
ncbi:MAG: hypothetical protein H7Y32_00970 [Chloroflexales bacterium]|nr:hypothetical protein [Chloroflexales bacterium]